MGYNDYMKQIVTKSRFTPAEIDHMREAGQIIAGLFRDVRPLVKSGVTGRYLNDWFAHEITARGAHASYLDSDVNFPGVICISVNDAVVHGVPNDTPLCHGDIVSFDLVVDVDGMKADSAFTMLADDIKPTGAVKMLLHSTEQSLQKGISAIHGPADLYKVGKAIEGELNNSHLGIVRDLVGHGIGRSMHEEPDVPNYSIPDYHVTVPVGNAIAIEPMATLGTDRVVQDSSDGWTIYTADGSLSAHFEHTILLTDGVPEIITKLK